MLPRKTVSDACALSSLQLHIEMHMLAQPKPAQLAISLDGSVHSACHGCNDYVRVAVASLLLIGVELQQVPPRVLLQQQQCSSRDSQQSATTDVLLAKVSSQVQGKLPSAQNLFCIKYSRGH
jgi:hypothetical protein